MIKIKYENFPRHMECMGGKEGIDEDIQYLKELGFSDDRILKEYVFEENELPVNMWRRGEGSKIE